jgi:hypothetical protein
MDIYALEDRWQAQLRAVSLVGQVDFSEDELAEACRFVRQKFATKIDPERRQYFEQFPAAILVAITSAARDYKSGTFWPKLEDRLGFPIKQANQAALASLYSRALDNLGLSRFSTPRARIGEMLVHATLPDSSAALFTKKLINLFKRDPDVSGMEIADHFQSIHRGSVQSHEIDVPILDFVLDAGEFAIYFIDECLSLIGAVADMRDTADEALGLASHTRATVLREASEAKLSARRGQIRHHRGNRARFELDPYSYTLYLALPIRAGQRGSEVWNVTWGGKEHRESSHPVIGGLARQTLIPLRSPDVQAILRNESTNEEITLSLFSAKSPYALFDQTGNWLGGTGSINSDALYALFAKTIDKQSASLLLDGTVEFDKRDRGAPAGWDIASEGDPQNHSAWNLLEFRPSIARRVGIRLGAVELLTSERRLGGQENPSLIDYNPVQGVRDMNGHEVVGALPSIFLPATGASETFCWAVRLVDLSSGEEVFAHDTPARTEDLIVRLPVKLINGSYKASVEGRKGFRRSFEFALIEGLDTSFASSARFFEQNSGKLEETTAYISATGHARELLSFGLGQERLSHEVAGLSLTVEPPRIRIRIDDETSVKALSGRVNLVTENLASTMLRISWPDLIPVRAELRLVTPRSQLLATAEPSRAGDGFVEFKLNRLTDAVPANGISWLSLESSWGSFLVARIAPPRILENCLLETGENRLELKVDTVPEGLKAGFFSSIASWRDPVIVDISTKYPEVPPETLAAGPFKVFFQLDDGWTPLQWDRRTGSNPNAYSLNSSEEIVPTTPEMSLVHWLHTGEKLDDLLAELPQEILWRCLTDPSVHSSRVTRSEVQKLCRDSLDADPNAAFANFPSKIHASDTYLELMFEADILDEKPDFPEERLLTLSNAVSAPALFAAAAAGTLRPGNSSFENAIDLWLGYSFSGAAADSEFEPGISDLIVSLLGWLSNEKHEVRFFLEKPAEQVEAIFNQLGLSNPAPMLSAASFAQQVLMGRTKAPEIWDKVAIARSDAAFEGFDRRFCQALRAGSEYERIEPLLRTRAPWPPGVEQLKGTFIALAYASRLSLRFAVLCRLAARGNAPASDAWHEFKAYHQHLARLVPRIVELDILLVEIFLCEQSELGAHNG